MSSARWVLLTKVNGDLPAEIFGGLLKAQGIPVLLSQEGAARAIGIDIGPFGEVEILVAAEYENQARQVWNDYRAGRYADTQWDPEQLENLNLDQQENNNEELTDID